MSAPESTVRRLADACPVRDATTADPVGGVPPRWVASPTSTEQVAALLRVAHEEDLAVVARGTGSAQDCAAPPRRLDLVVETGGLDQIVEYAPNDLVLRVGAGVRLDAVADLLAPHGQRLGVDPVRRGTVGGALAVGAAGPLRLSIGSARDLVIGMTCVRADGVVAHSGGKVVKNVAGYDLGKLFAGSFGTLGVITELTFRLHPLPEASCWVGGLLEVSAVLDGSAVAGALEALAQEQIVPAAVELDVPVDGRCSVWVQIEGTAAGLRQRADVAAHLLGEGTQLRAEPPFWWAGQPPGTAVLKVTHEIGRGPALAGALREAADRAGVRVAYRGSPLVGTAWLGVDADRPESAEACAQFAAFVEAARDRTARAGGTLVVLGAPGSWRASVDAWGPVAGLGVMRAIKSQFDPAGLLAPGRFVGGI